MLIYYSIGIALLALLLIARKARSANDREGTQLNKRDETNSSVKQKQNSSLIVASYNVQTGKNLQGQRNINRAAEILSRADIAGVQEVYAASWSNKFGIGLSQTEVLARHSNFDWLFCPTRLRWFRENRGNALLSKLPINSWRTTMLPDQSGNSFRNMTVANFEWQGQSCYFINTHLHTGKGQTEQLKVVLDEFSKYPNAILVGDFNTRPDNQLLQQFIKSNQAIDAISQSKIDQDETNRIDWILVSGWTVLSAHKIAKGVSDHPYYEVTLELKASP